jgi:hypothetical protein
MNASPLIHLCYHCEHALVTGVACDAHVLDCPLNRSNNAPTKVPSSYRHLRLISSQMALPSEYDAIRGED